MAPWSGAWVCLLAQVAASDKTCEDYFGNLDGIFTIADHDVGITDASSPYCDGSGVTSPCTYMHLAGHSCANPAPPDGCHRYHKVQYSECPELDNFNYAYDDSTRIDTTGAFNEQGVFTACADRVVSNEVLCFGPPAGSPEQCECPSDEASMEHHLDEASLEQSSPQTSTQGGCADYFGSFCLEDAWGVCEGSFTVADPDVGITEASASYCEGSGMPSPCTYVHFTGAACEAPAPPDGCHRYHKVQYDECPELDHFRNANHYPTGIDTTGVFNDQGVFAACADRVIKNELFCYGPPAGSPTPCECPSDATVISI